MLISLKNDSVSAVIETVGAELQSLKDRNKKEYIWQRNPDIWPRCSPLLFPVVGNCRNGRTRFEGEWFEMEKHGFCKESDFTVVRQSDHTVTFRLAANAQTRRSYPYEFVLSLTYRLKNGVLLLDYCVENSDSREICYGIGSHPGFVCPLEKEESFEDYQLEFETEEDTCAMPYDLQSLQFDAEGKGLVLSHTRVLPLSYELFRGDAIYFDSIRSRRVSLVHRHTRRGIEVSYPGFETIACMIGIVIFLGYTAYDTQKIKAYYEYYGNDAAMASKASVFSALALYLDFINIFIYLLRILGKRRN